MKYILGLFIIVFIIACSDSATKDAAQTSANTQNLQPVVENKDIQPPRPPSL